MLMVATPINREKMSNSLDKATPKSGWNLMCDSETHEALDILGAWMVGKVPDELKKSVKVSKTKVIKFLATEKLHNLGLLQKNQEVAKV